MPLKITKEGRWIVGERQLLIHLKELRYLEVFCKEENCQIGIVLDMGSDTQGYPTHCPACGSKFDGIGEGLPQKLSKFKAFYKEFANSKVNPRFRITPTD